MLQAFFMVRRARRVACKRNWFDPGCYALGLFNAKKHKDQNRYWLIHLKKGTQGLAFSRRDWFCY